MESYPVSVIAVKSTPGTFTRGSCHHHTQMNTTKKQSIYMNIKIYCPIIYAQPSSSHLPK